MALWDNNVGRWKLANGDWTDSSPNGNNLTPVTAPSQATGHGGGANLAASFDGATTGLYISDTNQTGLDFSNALTMSVWIKLDNYPPAGQIMAIVNKWLNSGNLSYWFGINDSGIFYLALSDNGTNEKYIGAPGALNIGVWYHLMATYDGSNVRLYVNNVLKTTVAHTTGIYNSTEKFSVGKWASSAGYFDGIIDDLAFWNRVLSDGERASLYSAADDFVISTTTQPSTIQLVSSVENPSITTAALIRPSTILFSKNILDPGINIVLIQPSAFALTETVPDPTVALLFIIVPTPATGTFSIPDPDILGKNVLIGVANFPSGKTVSYKIVDDFGTVLQDWTTVEVQEVVIDATIGKSTYFAKTSIINQDFQGIVLWKTNDNPPYTASESFNIYQSYMINVRSKANIIPTIDDNVDAIKAKTDNLPATPADETTVSQRPTLAQIEASTVLAKQAKLDFVEKWILNKLVENPDGTFTLYDDDDVTPLKTWTVSGKTRNKAV